MYDYYPLLHLHLNVSVGVATWHDMQIFAANVSIPWVIKVISCRVNLFLILQMHQYLDTAYFTIDRFISLSYLCPLCIVLSQMD